MWGLGLLVTLTRWWPKAAATFLFISIVPIHSVTTFYVCCDEKSGWALFIYMLWKKSIRNSTLVFDACFLPLKYQYLRFDRTFENQLVVTFPEGVLVYLSVTEMGERLWVIGKNDKRSKGVLGLFLPFYTIYHFLFGFNREAERVRFL